MVYSSIKLAVVDFKNVALQHFAVFNKMLVMNEWHDLLQPLPRAALGLSQVRAAAKPNADQVTELTSLWTSSGVLSHLKQNILALGFWR